MANRSKKVVLSARVAPYIKAALEAFADSKNEKIVKLLEHFIEQGLYERMVENPLSGKKEKVAFMHIFNCIWTEDEVLYQLRLGALGSNFSGEDAAYRVILLQLCPEFDGADDVFGDLNGSVQKFGYRPPYNFMINLERVRAEWAEFNQYAQFLRANRPFEPTYEEWKEIANRHLKG